MVDGTDGENELITQNASFFSVQKTGIIFVPLMNFDREF